MKFLETILTEKLPFQLPQLSLLATRQHGSLPCQPTVANLLHAEGMVTQWFDEGSAVDVAYPDFAKALGSVKHRLLFIKAIESPFPQ